MSRSNDVEHEEIFHRLDLWFEMVRPNTISSGVFTACPTGSRSLIKKDAI